MQEVVSRESLRHLYLDRKKSVCEIARRFHCSQNRVNYWFRKYDIPKRTLSEAAYVKRNPKGDPFLFTKPISNANWFLFGLGIGLYWGEGTRKNKTQVRLGNTDPDLILKFLEFIERIYKVQKKKIRFGLQVFSDMSPREVIKFWCRKLNVSRKKFGKVIVTPARSIGTYREKTRHGVLTIYISNSKLRNLLCNQIELMRQIR